jgi:hypothetical protein
VAAPRSLWLRSTFDTDPSLYIGRFLGDVVTPDRLDESAGQQKSCSRFVKYKTVGGGGVLYDEYYNASTGASISAKIPQIATVSVGAQVDRTVRVKYQIDQKLVSYIDDPDGFQACCMRAPDQCTARYIGEFVSGVGAVYFGSGRSVGGKVGMDLAISGIDSKIFPSLEVKDARTWERSVVFPQPVYFGFKVYDNAFTGQLPDWTCESTEVPRSSLGYYFVGVSEVLDSAAQARDAAATNARRQVVQFLGEQVATGSTSTTASSTALGTRLQNDTFVTTAAAGLARFVQVVRECPTQVPLPSGYSYSSKVLAFVPNVAVGDATGVLLEQAP